MSTGCKPLKFINQYSPEAEKFVCLSETTMKLAWNKKNKSKKRPLADISKYPNLPFENTNDPSDKPNDNQNCADETSESAKLFHSFQAQGTKLAEDGKYREALGKWEAALMLKPENSVLHEQKAQVLLEIGDAWNAVKAATRAIELEPSWAEAWVTLGRAQLNFGEPDNAVESFDRALAIKPNSEEARDDRDTAMQLVKRRKQLHSSGMSPTRNRYAVGDKT